MRFALNLKYSSKKKQKTKKHSINSLNIFFHCGKKFSVSHVTWNVKLQKFYSVVDGTHFFPLSPSVLSKIASPSLRIQWVLCSGSLNRPARLRTSGIISRVQPDINHPTLTSVQVITFYMTLHAKQTAVTTCRKVQWKERETVKRETDSGVKVLNAKEILKQVDQEKEIMYWQVKYLYEMHLNYFLANTCST